MIMRPIIVALVCILALGAPAFAQDQPPDIMAAMNAATERFAGRIVAAELVEGRPEEQTAQVFEFRMLTDAGDILRIRVDAQDNAILDVDGYGLVAARKPVTP